MDSSCKAKIAADTGHYPERIPTNNGRTCKVCQFETGKKAKKSNYKCKLCSLLGQGDIALCVSPCFEKYHRCPSRYARKNDESHIYTYRNEDIALSNAKPKDPFIIQKKKEGSDLSRVQLKTEKKASAAETRNKKSVEGNKLVGHIVLPPDSFKDFNIESQSTTQNFNLIPSESQNSCELNETGFEGKFDSLHTRMNNEEKKDETNLNCLSNIDGNEEIPDKKEPKEYQNDQDYEVQDNLKKYLGNKKNIVNRIEDSPSKLGESGIKKDDQKEYFSFSAPFVEILEKSNKMVEEITPNTQEKDCKMEIEEKKEE